MTTPTSELKALVLQTKQLVYREGGLRSLRLPKNKRRTKSPSPKKAQPQAKPELQQKPKAQAPPPKKDKTPAAKTPPEPKENKPKSSQSSAFELTQKKELPLDDFADVLELLKLRVPHLKLCAAAKDTDESIDKHRDTPEVLVLSFSEQTQDKVFLERLTQAINSRLAKALLLPATLLLNEAAQKRLEDNHSIRLILVVQDRLEKSPLSKILESTKHTVLKLRTPLEYSSKEGLPLKKALWDDLQNRLKKPSSDD